MRDAFMVYNIKHEKKIGHHSFLESLKLASFNQCLMCFYLWSVWKKVLSEMEASAH